MTRFEGKMWNMIGSIGWVESGYDMQPMIDMMLREDEETLRTLDGFVTTRCTKLVQRIRDFELVSNTTFNLTDEELAHLATEVVSRGKLAYDTYTTFPRRLTGLHTNYHYTLPRLARVHN